ncbi:hypothetical protein SADUNF_Sadunf06G0119500 [Salix dunnii]|uniref:Retrotransposon gag domain-containing protein n=1 Tax=Salix dunnii TaxID=1413687 RepID=A0A835N0P4_9ROSI|nr:hypothetical protein SADUNF_Sadunf06G0119500 [Salix dunnii]
MSINKRLDSIDSQREGFDQTFPPSDEDDGDGYHKRVGMDHLPPEKKVKTVSFHLDREALQWYQYEECASSFSKWEDFTKAFCGEFGSHEFEDFAEALFKLHQTGSLKDYIAEFRRLATQIRDLSPTFQTEIVPRKDMPVKKLTLEEIQYKSAAGVDALMHWKGYTLEDATWENDNGLRPNFLISLLRWVVFEAGYSLMTAMWVIITSMALTHQGSEMAPPKSHPSLAVFVLLQFLC